MEQVYAVIDMKSFYASCECAARGLDIFTTPLVVADKERSENSIVMSATPYLKEKYHCSNVCRIKDLPNIPEMIFARPRMEYYLRMSAKIVSLFLDYVAEEDLHVYSVDESFLYLTPYLHLYGGSPEKMVSAIQAEIKARFRMIATAGLGPNMFLAKTCLDNEGKHKPPYLAHWKQKQAKEKLWAIHPITKVWGISGGISAHLAKVGIHSLRDLARSDPAFLKKEFGVLGTQLYEMANGIDHSDIHEKYVPKDHNLSIGQTLMRDYDLKGARLLLREMNDDLCFRLRTAGRKAGCVSVYCGYSSYAGGGGFSREASLDIATDDNAWLYEAIVTLFDRHASNLPIRSLGISFSRLSPYGAQQYSLFESETELEERHNLYLAMDAVHAMYGPNSLLRASSLTEESTALLRHTQIGGHNA